MANNPWEANTPTRKAWVDKWNEERRICQEDCPKKMKCNALDRMDKNVCILLNARLG